MSAFVLAVLIFACDPVVPSVGETLPAVGATGIPANAAIVFDSTVRDGTVTAMVVLTSAAGGFSGPAVLGDGDVFVFDPGADLAAGNWLAMISLDGPGGGFGKNVSFTVGAAADIVPPVFAGDVVFDVGNYVDAGPFEDCPDPPPVYAVASDWDDATDVSPVRYAVRGLLLTQSQVTIGAPPSETLALEVFAYDAAGGASALPVAELDVPAPPGDDGGGCSCGVTGARTPRGALALAFAVSLLAFVARRRTRE